jgi:hypothetical protein
VTDPLAPLGALPGVPEAVALARADVDALLWERSLRTKGAAMAAESVLRGARASAAIEGAEVALEALRAGAAVDGSPLGREVGASVRVSSEVPRLTPPSRTALAGSPGSRRGRRRSRARRDARAARCRGSPTIRCGWDRRRPPPRCATGCWRWPPC